MAGSKSLREELQIINSFSDSWDETEEKLVELILSKQKEAEQVLKDIIIHAAPDGKQDGDFIGFYVLPTGSIHKGIAYFQDKGGIRPMGDVTVISQYQKHIKELSPSTINNVEEGKQ